MVAPALAIHVGLYIYTLCLKKRHPFYFCDIFVKLHPILLIFGINVPRKFETNLCTRPIHISFYMFVLYLVKTTEASERTQRRRPLLVCLLIEPECCTFFKSLFELLTLQPLSENSRINLLPPKTWNLYKFSVKMRTSAAPDCCMICSGLHQHVIGEAIDHVAWTAARLCENWWTRLQTLAGIIWTLLDSYLMRQFGFYVETSYFTL